MIKVGDTLPAATLMEYAEVEGSGCSIGPNPVDAAKAAIHYVAPVGEKEQYVERALANIAPYLPLAS